jgi:hypothetical protein
MSVIASDSMEEALVQLVNNNKKLKAKFKLKKYQAIGMYIYESDVMKEILEVGKFKDIGNIYDYPKLLPQPKFVNGYDISANFESYQRIAISNKFNCIVLYSFVDYGYFCSFFVSTKKLEEFSQQLKMVTQKDSSQLNLFQDVDFKCEPGEYIEISKFIGKSETAKPVSVVKKSVIEEKLVFDKNSTLYEVIKDILAFFTEERKELCAKLDIPYKRGAMLHSDPGQGKSATIRELIRKSTVDVSRIVIHPNVSYEVTQILSSLLKSLKGTKAIIILEDFDALISQENRSEFLNILDGVDIKSGVYIIGTTNYPEQIDPAFVNRAGRFDVSFKIENPSDDARRLFFESRNIAEIFSDHIVEGQDILDLFTKNTENMPMASLKEVITSTKYILAGGSEMTLEAAITDVCSKLKTAKSEHEEAHDNFNDEESYRPERPRRRRRPGMNRSGGAPMLSVRGVNELRHDVDIYGRNEAGYISLFIKEIIVEE